MSEGKRSAFLYGSRWGLGEGEPFPKRIQRAAFAITMLVILVFGGVSMAISLAEIPRQQRALHRDAVRVVGDVFAGDLDSRIGELMRLSQSALVWTALTDSAGREAYLKPLLAARSGLSADMRMMLLDYRGRPLAGDIQADEALLQPLVKQALGDGRPRFIVTGGAQSSMLTAWPVEFPYTSERIGVLAARVDVAALFERRANGLGENLAVDLVYGDGTISRWPPSTADRYYPVRREIKPTEEIDGAALALELYATHNPWTWPILVGLATSLAGAVVLGLLIWQVTGAIAQRTTRRLMRLVDYCTAINRKEHAPIPEDPYPDEIGTLARALKDAVDNYDRINENLSALVEMRTKALTESEERLELSVRGANLVIVDWDIAVDLIVFGAGWEKLLGCPRAELPAKSAQFARLVWPDDIEAVRAALRSNMKGQTPFIEMETRLLHADGHWTWVHVRATVVERNADGRAVRMAGTVMDIADKKRAELEVARLSKLNESLLNSAGEGIYGIDLEGRCTFVNPSALAMLGLDKQAMIGEQPHRLFHARREDGSPYPRETCATAMTLQDGIRRNVEDFFTRSTGEVFAVQMSVTPMHEEDRIVGAEVVFQDITQRKAMEAELMRLATTDPLTGITNRRRFMEQLEQELARVRRSGEPAALLMLDIDHFKRVNDSHGHAVGDAVLQHVVKVAHMRLRQTDGFGRLGGEEFAVLLPATDGSGATLFAESLREMLAGSPAEIDGLAVAVTVSIGVTAFASGDERPDRVLSRADAALYDAKAKGRNRVEVRWRD